MPDARATTLNATRLAERDTTSEVVLLVALHTALIAVPVFVVTVFLIPLLLALIVAVVAGAVVTALRLRNIDTRLASAVGAVALAEGDRPRLDSVTESVAMAVGVATPQLSLIDSPSCNAIVWGSGSGPVRLAVTSGLVDSMDRLQLEAVMGHQLAIVANGGIDVVTIGSALFGPLARGPLEAFVGSFVHRTVRARSVVVADLEGARATRYPPGLVLALEAIQGTSTAVETIPPTLSVLCFAPITDASGPFSVHPPVEDRIDLLREI